MAIQLAFFLLVLSRESLDSDLRVIIHPSSIYTPTWLVSRRKFMSVVQVPVHLCDLTGMPNADEMVDLAKSASEEMFKREGFSQTVSIMYCDGPKRVAALVCAADFPTKRHWLEFLVEMAERLTPTAVVTSSEVWMLDQPYGKADESVRPSESPDRVEYLAVTIENKAGMSAWRARIDRKIPGDEKSEGTVQAWELMTLNARGVGTLAEYFCPAPKA
jgi:hypothetical protein